MNRSIKVKAAVILDFSRGPQDALHDEMIDLRAHREMSNGEYYEWNPEYDAEQFPLVAEYVKDIEGVVLIRDSW